MNDHLYEIDTMIIGRSIAQIDCTDSLNDQLHRIDAPNASMSFAQFPRFSRPASAVPAPPRCPSNSPPPQHSGMGDSIAFRDTGKN